MTPLEEENANARGRHIIKIFETSNEDTFNEFLVGCNDLERQLKYCPNRSDYAFDEPDVYF